MKHGFFSFVGLDGVDNVQEWHTNYTDAIDKHGFFWFVGLDGVDNVQEWHTDETDEGRIFLVWVCFNGRFQCMVVITITIEIFRFRIKKGSLAISLYIGILLRLEWKLGI
jgi:hypothetical protein